MKKFLVFILLLFSLSVFAQDSHVYAIRNSNHEGYSILNQKGKFLFQLPRYSEPIFDGIIRTGAYPNLIEVPVTGGNFGLRYINGFLLIDTLGQVVKTLHPNTEWVHPFENNIARVTLKKFGPKEFFCDLYIDSSGDNVFGDEIFKDGTNFVGTTAAVQFMESNDWFVIDTNRTVLVNISELFGDIITSVAVEQENIWRINFSFSATLYISSDGDITKELSVQPSYQSNTRFINEGLLNRLSEKRTFNPYKYQARPQDHFILYEYLNPASEKEPVAYSNQNEQKILLGFDGVKKVMPLKKLNRYMVGRAEDGSSYYLYNRTDLKLTGSVPNEPAVAGDHIVLTTNRINDYEQENVAYNFKGAVVFSPKVNYKIAKDTTVLKPTDINELNLFNPTELDFQSLKTMSRLEVLSIYDLKESDFPIEVLVALPNLKVLNLTRCRALTTEALNRSVSTLEFLNIKQCNQLSNFKPAEDKWPNLTMYSHRYQRNLVKSKGFKISK